MRTLIVACSALAACFNPKYNDPMCGPQGECPSGLTCASNVCVAERPNDAIVGDMQCSAPPMCEDAMTLRDCNGSTACAQGCSDTPTPHCKQIVPSNGVDLTIVKDTIPMSVISGSSVTVNSDDGSVMAGALSVRAAGEGLIGGIYFGKPTATTAVFGMESLTVPTGATITVVGSRAVVLVVRDNVQIDGVLILHGIGAQHIPGPGGGVGGISGGAAGCAPGVAGVVGTYDGGGGGGGFGGAGASGGMPDAGVAAPGGPTCGTATLTPLVGGSGGGKGGGPSGGAGGGGGGAAQLVALGSIIVNGVIDAGGRGGAGTSAGDDAPGAGGAGGGVLLEAPVVTINASGKVVANGGGGGGGGNQNGQDGQQSAAAAVGGGSGCKGGNGGSSTAQAQPGSNNCAFPSGTAAGGGGVGRIRFNSVGSATIVGTTSPTPTVGALTVE